MELRTGGARNSKVYKKVTDRAQVSNELGAEEQLQLHYRSDPRGGESAGNSRHVAQERTHATARPGNCQSDRREGVPCELCT